MTSSFASNFSSHQAPISETVCGGKSQFPRAAQDLLINDKLGP
jgi:hypothetical protein